MYVQFELICAEKYSLGEEFAMERLDAPRKAETSTASYAVRSNVM